MSGVLSWQGLARNDLGRVAFGKSNGNGPLHLLGIDRAPFCSVRRFGEYALYGGQNPEQYGICKRCRERAESCQRREAREAARVAPPARRGRAKRDLAEVAEIYLEAAHTGDSPIKAIQERLGVRYGTAATLATQARKAGLLPNVSQRRNAKAVAVAEALGVDYDLFVAAVREHADGELRFSGQRKPSPSAYSDTPSDVNQA